MFRPPEHEGRSIKKGGGVSILLHCAVLLALMNHEFVPHLVMHGSWHLKEGSAGGPSTAAGRLLLDSVNLVLKHTDTGFPPLRAAHAPCRRKAGVTAPSRRGQRAKHASVCNSNPRDAALMTWLAP